MDDRDPMSVGYLRRSKSAAHQKYSALNQLRAILREYKHLRGGNARPPRWAGRYVDNATSGSIDCMNRPEARRMLRDLQHGDHLWLYSIDRLGRSCFDIIEVVNVLAKRGVKIHVVDLGGECLALDSIAGKFVLFGVAIAAELERDRIINRTKETHATLVATGRPINQHPPSGVMFKWATIDGVQVEAKNERAIAVARWCRDLKKNQGYTMIDIAERIIDEDVRVDGRLWCRRTVASRIKLLEKMVSGGLVGSTVS